MPKIGLVSLPKERLSDVQATPTRRPPTTSLGQCAPTSMRLSAAPTATAATSIQHTTNRMRGKPRARSNDGDYAQPNKECDVAAREAVAGDMRRGMGKAGGSWPGNDDVDAGVDGDVQRGERDEQRGWSTQYKRDGDDCHADADTDKSLER
jgi:hypothetical protein